MQKFPGTVFPTFPSTVLSFSDSNVKVRQNTLDSFVKFIACTPRLVACSTTLEFLGKYCVCFSQDIGNSQEPFRS